MGKFDTNMQKKETCNWVIPCIICKKVALKECIYIKPNVI